MERELSCLANRWTLNETMVLKIYKFCHSCIALSFYATVLECGTPLHFKMPRNRKRECPACFKQVRSDVLKTHCRIKHGMSDDQIDALKNYSCKYCKKHFSRSINCRYHELHCKPRKPGDVSYRHDFQFGTGTERNGDFEEIFQGFDHTLVVYRKQLANDNNMDNLKIAVDDAITILQKEVAVRPGMKWYFVLTLAFKKAAHEEEVTDPPVVLNMRPKTGFVATNYERHLNEAMEDITEKIDSFESTGSGWIVDKFQTLDLKIATYAPLGE